MSDASRPRALITAPTRASQQLTFRRVFVLAFVRPALLLAAIDPANSRRASRQVPAAAGSTAQKTGQQIQRSRRKLHQFIVRIAV